METDSSSERASVAVARLVRSKSLFARFTTKRYVCFFGHKAIAVSYTHLTLPTKA